MGAGLIAAVVVALGLAAGPASAPGGSIDERSYVVAASPDGRYVAAAYTEQGRIAVVRIHDVSRPPGAGAPPPVQEELRLDSPVDDPSPLVQLLSAKLGDRYDLRALPAASLAAPDRRFLLRVSAPEVKKAMVKGGPYQTRPGFEYSVKLVLVGPRSSQVLEEFRVPSTLSPAQAGFGDGLAVNGHWLGAATLVVDGAVLLRLADFARTTVPLVRAYAVPPKGKAWSGAKLARQLEADGVAAMRRKNTRQALRCFLSAQQLEPRRDVLLYRTAAVAASLMLRPVMLQQLDKLSSLGTRSARARLQKVKSDPSFARFARDPELLSRVAGR